MRLDHLLSKENLLAPKAQSITPVRTDPNLISLFNFEGPQSLSCGGIAQLGERLPCKQEVNGSIPFISTSRNISAHSGLGLSTLKTERHKELK